MSKEEEARRVTFESRLPADMMASMARGAVRASRLLRIQDLHFRLKDQSRLNPERVLPAAVFHRTGDGRCQLESERRPASGHLLAPKEEVEDEAQLNSLRAPKIPEALELFAFCTLCTLQPDVVLGENLPDKPIILVIEDDEAIQALLEDALTEGGFETAFVTSGEEAVTLLKRGIVAYLAVVTDINLMGRFNGWEVARTAREVNSNFPIVYMSGAVADQWSVQGVPNSIMLQKPFAPAQVLTALSNLLNGRSLASSS
ncbi:response regulator [Bradyrhizobium sp. 153]|uniref:response regulator n=1 Tax=Bradyrhizobium sp. 153 TaxID=2782627 RepID=UPI0031FA2F32